MEELDLDTKNLCTTEDAFEQFQSGAMYEEDEFITLSDIVSSPHTNQDVNEMLHDDPCDELSMSIQEEKVVNNINIPPYIQKEVLNVNTEMKQNNENTSTSKKRGRKKKSSLDNSDVQQTQSEFDLNKPTKPKRRSRKSVITSDANSDPKYAEQCSIEELKTPIHMTGMLIKPANKAKRKNQNSCPPEEIKEQLKKKGRKPKQTRKKIQKELVNEDINRDISITNIGNSNISPTTATVDIKKTKHKRGRKKHNILSNPVPHDVEMPPKECEIKSVILPKTENNKLENSVSILPLSEENTKKSEIHDKQSSTNKGTLKNISGSEFLSNCNSEEDIEDLPLSNLSKKTENELEVDINTTLENTNFSDLNIISKSSTTNSKEKIIKKRGRPKKVSVNSPAKPDLDVKNFTNENNEKCENINVLNTQVEQNKFDNPEIISEPVISPVNEPQVSEVCDNIIISTDSSQSKRNSKKKLIPEFEYNVDSVVKNDTIEETQKIHEDIENLDTEDSSRRPVRRRVLKNWNYDEGSDEDPYANVESSDDEPRRRKKGGRYYSDDDYFPGKKRPLTESESDMAIDEVDINLHNRPQKKKKSRRSDLLTSNKSPIKKGRKSDAESVCTTEKTNTDSGDVDFDDCLDSLTMAGNDNQVTPTKSKRKSQLWVKKNEIQNYLAKIVQGTDIKISKKSADNAKTSLQIPVIEATEAKKSVEKSSQTVTVNTKPAAVQTDTVYEIPMKDQVPLTSEQSEKACDFLSGIVQTTAELGQLMTQKSEDFITKKINTKYVTDTFKMDYCVKKSFLLFKLAKHNLVQMEEDLSKQYEEFLKENNLIQHRQEQKIIASTSKASDSDCEIVEEPVKNKVAPQAQKPAFNPKTVFLNKELSIKIAKKNTEEPAPKKKLNIKGRHSVWINDSVLVKKVKPNQSFLAQDSRNKKPPDNKITLEKVNEFFRMHERQKAVYICAPYIRTEWFGRARSYMCNYFVDSITDFPEKTIVMQNEHVVSEVAFVEHDSNQVIGRTKPEEPIESCPETLFLICTKIVQNCLHPKKMYTNAIAKQTDINQWEHVTPYLKNVTNNVEETQLLTSDINKNIICFKANYNKSKYVQTLKTLCFKRVMELMNSAYYGDGKPNLTTENVNTSVAVFNEKETNNVIKMKKNTSKIKQIKSLLSLCIKAIQKTQKSQLSRNINYIKYRPESLKSLSLFKVQYLINGITRNTTLDRKLCNVKTLLHLCIDATNKSSYGYSITNNTSLEQKFYQVKSLLKSCIGCTNYSSNGNSIINNTSLEPKLCNMETPLQLCIDATNTSSYENSITNNTILEPKVFNVKTPDPLYIDATNTSSNGNSITNNTNLKTKVCTVKTPRQLCIDVTNNSSYGNSITNNTSTEQQLCNVKTLLQLCLEATSSLLYFTKLNNVDNSEPLFFNKNNPLVNSVLSLKSICRNRIAELSTEWYMRQNMVHEVQSQKTSLNITINNVNTVSGDIFLDATSDDDTGDIDNENYVVSSYKNEEEQSNYSDEECDRNYDGLGEDDNNWVSQVQMQELRSCLDQSRNIEMGNKISDIDENIGQDSIVIKRDPDEYQPETIDPSKIKTEPGDDHEYMGESNNYSSIITKQEVIVDVQIEKELISQHSSSSYDEELFESFVSSNKMITSLNDSGTPSNEIFSQSSQRVRRQYEPDSDDETDDLTDTMNLLVPQNLESKDRLLESSQDEIDEKEYKKSDKKKPEKRKVKLKKIHKDVPNKGKILQKNEVTIFTRKMKDKIRQEQTKSDSSDSEPNCLKFKIGKAKLTENKSIKESETKRREEEEKVIQCNDVDSTEVITENKYNLTLQNNEKYEDLDENNIQNFSYERSPSPLIDSNEPVEVLECEPTLPIFDELINEEHKLKKNIDIYTSDGMSYVDRYGWQCFPIDKKDNKIYTHAHVQLDKLPESFVDTYFKYQDVSDKTTEDLEVDKLTNLQTLQRTRPKQDDLSKPKTIEKKIKVRDTSVVEEKEKPLKTETLEAFFPSEDESTPNVDECIPPTPVQNSENHFAKKLLMNNDSDTEKNDVDSEKSDIDTEQPDIDTEKPDIDTEKPDIETEKPDIDTKKPYIDTEKPDIDTQKPDIDTEKPDIDTEKPDINKESTTIKIEKMEDNTYKTRSGRKVKCKIENTELWKDDLVLTADKVMNKELALLHAPVDLKEEEEEEDTKDPMIKSYNKNSQKYASKGPTRYRIKTEDDSSSEEEKQWFTTKEKLLKRLLKKNEDTKVDDAKRAKIVSEFIEKRGELPEPRQRPRARARCSRKAIMERRKQIKILSRELFGVDTVYTKKYSPASTSKGRRNIRKVIDKKSLALSTVVANMEEFERKRRLTIRQAQLREDLGCEEGVNVVVINDELCLEYDFEEKRPVVSVHQFFTKVMKAHQYEGVKFMWDACFESVAQAAGGGAGGGCILAHCMGLGKTLQVLALLHTVLTHPQVGMRRVLVCCPLSTVLNWVDEIHKWIGPVTNDIKVFELSKLKKTYERAYQLEDWYNGGGIFIIGYELFRSLSTLDPVLDCVRPTIVNKIRTALLDPGPDIIVCDEGHLLKNDCSVLAVAMSRVVTKRRIILTGTPMQNNLREYYCMVNFVKPNLLGSYSEYSNRFENPIMNGQHRDSREEDIKLMKARTHILHKVLEGCLQRQEASVLYPYLPKKYEYTVFISLTKCQWELYKHYITHYINTKENKQSVLRDFHVLQKIWTHPLVLNNFLMKTGEDEKEPKLKAEKLDDDLEESREQAAPSAAAWWARTDHRHVLHQLDSSYKFLVVFRLLHECVELGDKVLIFSTSLYAMDALEFFLNRENKWTLGREYYRLDGSVPAEVRQKWCREFNAPQNTSTKLFLISTRAGSLGLNMTAANRVIILDTSWNPAHDIQSIFRVYRFGQKKDCYIYRLVAMGTMEQKIYERSVTKQAVSCRVVDEQQIDRHYNMAELSELYSLDEAGSGVAAGLAADVRDAALLRVAAVGAGAGAGGGGLHAVHEHDSLLRGSSESGLPEHERNAAWMQFQQEHATTHIQNFEINVPNKSTDDTKVLSKKSNVKLEKESNDSPGDTPSKIIKKRRRKVKKKKKNPEPQPSISHQDLNPDMEENMIKKIMNILIKHNFHTTKGPEEISALVISVRDVVARAHKKLKSLKDVDPLTASIARVLLESENIKFPEDKIKQTDNNDDNQKASDDDTNIMEMDLKERKRRRNLIDSDEEYVPDTRKRKPTAKVYTRKSNESIDSNNTSVVIDSANESTEVTTNKEEGSSEVISNKEEESTEVIVNKDDERREVIANKEDGADVIANKEVIEKDSAVFANKEDNLDVVANKEMIEKKPVVGGKRKLETLEFPKEISSESDQIEKTDKRKIKQYNKKDNTAKKDVPKEKEASEIILTIENDECIEVDDKCDTQNITEEAPPIQPMEDESICLSDDDEPIITEPAPIEPKIAEPSVVETIEKEDTIPLHKSVLTNKNFIKLVAHTYLTGNPMLDEDAALLAAQYSALKALKEVQATGKDLTSGPLHEIAMKVLGRDLLKRLFVANPNKSTAETMLLKTDDLQNKTMNDMLLKNFKQEIAKQKAAPIKVSTKPEQGTKTTNKRKGILRKAIEAKEDNVKASQSTPKSSQEPVPSETASAKVVPVSIFKGIAAPSSQQLSVEECILPDDDEVIISTPSRPSTVQPQLARRNSRQLIVNAVSSKDSSGRDQKSAHVQELVPIASVLATRAPTLATTDSSKPTKVQPSTIENTSRNKNETVQNAAKSDNKFTVNIRKNTAPCHVTICLDSDEEELSVVNDKNLAKSDSRTLIVSPLIKKTDGKDNKMIMVPVTSVSSSSPTAGESSKARTVSIDPRKQIIQERNASKVTETKCKPGDIIRINETGKVEILKRVTGKEFVAKSQTTKLNEDNRSDSNLKNLKKPDKLAKTVLEKPDLLKEDKRKEIPSTSQQQKDPELLSVLKNVVHIPAYKYDKIKASKPSVEKLSQTSLSTQEESTKLHNSKLQEVQPIITYVNPPQVTNNNDKQTTVKKKMDVTKSVNSIKPNEVLKAKGDTSNGVIIDLTSYQHDQTKMTNFGGRTNETPADSSKDTGMNKVTSVVSDPKKSNVNTIRNTKNKAKILTTLKVVPSTSDSKRSSPWSEGAQSKKIKTDPKKKLTLQDFNLDDFDDIIELE